MRREPAPARRSRFVPALAVLLVGGLLAGGAMFAALLFGWFPSGTVTQDRSAPVVLQQLQDLSQYKAAQGQFSQVVDVEHDVRYVPDFLAGDRTVMVAVGSVDAEIDFSRLDAEHISVSGDGRRVEIHLPPAQLAEPRLDHEQTHVASRQRGFANRVNGALTTNADDDQELMAQAQRSLTAAAHGTELTLRAQDNTRAMLTGLMQSLGFDEVVVTFDAPVP